MDSPAGGAIGNIVGRTLGVLSALPSRGGGFSNLANYMARRAAVMTDPESRAALVGSPLLAGFYNIGGGVRPGPPTVGAVAAPSDFMGPTIPTPAGPAQSLFARPGAPVWQPDLPPMPAPAGTVLPEEVPGAIEQARRWQEQAGPGSTVQVKTPTGVIMVGSQYAGLGQGGTFDEATAQRMAAQTGGVPVFNGRFWTVEPRPKVPGVVETPAQGEMPLEQLQPTLQPGQIAQPTGRRDAQGNPLYQAVTPPKVDQRPATLPQLPAPQAPAPAAQPPAQPAAQPPARPAAPAPAPRAAPAPQPAVPAPAPPPVADPNQVIPHVMVKPGPPVPPLGPIQLPGGGTIGYPSGAFLEGEDATPGAALTAAAQVPAVVEPRPTQGPAAARHPTPLIPPLPSGQVDLNAPFLRTLEASRGLPSGVLSAMADKESSGFPTANAADPNSSARGLFQITRDTARAWGISANDRFDPVKSAVATADTLARRAQSVGIERAIGMHYGGPGTPFTQPVGSSGLSPAGYAADVLDRAQQFTGGGVERVGFPSPAFADETTTPAPSPTVPTLRLPPTAAPAPPPLPAPVPGPGGTQLKGVTQESQAGERRTFEAPADLGQAQREAIMRADVARLREGASESERKVLGDLFRYRNALNAFEEQYADPATYAPYLGARAELQADIGRKLASWTGRQSLGPDAGYVQFHSRLAPFGLDAFRTTGASMSPHELAIVEPNIPTGREPTVADFQAKIPIFREALDDVIAWRLATQGLPREQLTQDLFNQFLDQRRADRAAARTATTPTTTAPPSTSTTTEPPAPGPWRPTMEW